MRFANLLLFLFFVVSCSTQNMNQSCDDSELFRSPSSLKTSSCTQLLLSTPGRFDDDRNFLQEWKDTAANGVINSAYDEEFKTRIYYASTGVPEKDGRVPRVDPAAKALVLFVHGAGTMKARGENFNHRANDLASLGYAPLSLDLPFHGEGPTDPTLKNLENFIDWFDRFLDKYSVKGQPIYLIGHSFGPSFIAEYLLRKPGKVKGALLISPTSFDEETKHWYKTYTNQMPFRDTITVNKAGGGWASAIAGSLVWTDTKSDLRKKLTEEALGANHETDVHVLYGDREEFLPTPLKWIDGRPNVDGPTSYDVEGVLRKLLGDYVNGANIRFHRIANIGHKVFGERDEAGTSLVAVKTLDLLGVRYDSAQELAAWIKEVKLAKNRQNEVLSPEIRVLLKYDSDAIFHEWLERRTQFRHLQQMYRTNDVEMASSILRDFDKYLLERENQLYKAIGETKTTAPEFYKSIEKEYVTFMEKRAKQPNLRSDPLKYAYLDFLNGNQKKDETPSEKDPNLSGI